MTTWRCAHDSSHRRVQSPASPGFCATYIAARMQCGALMEEEPSDKPAATRTTPTTHSEKGPMSKLIQMSSGAPDIAPGNYIVTLTELTGPRTATMPDGEEVQFLDWTFATEDGGEFTDSSTTKTGPKSKTRQWIAALIGRVPGKDEGFDPKDLIGRQAVVTIEDRDGWPRISNMGVLMRQPAPQPVQPVAQSAAAPALTTVPELPLG